MSDKISPYVAQLFVSMGYNVSMVKPIWTITEAAKYGESFSSRVLRVEVRDDPEASDPAILSPHVLGFIVKLPPADTKSRESIFSTAHAFRREVFFYKSILPAFQEFQIAHRRDAISMQFAGFDMFKSVPRFLYASNINRAEYVVLGDLCKDGYANVERTQPLSETRVRLVLQRLAQFHAISFAFKAQKPQEFQRVLLMRGEEQLREIMFARPVRPDVIAKMLPNVQLVLDALAVDADLSDLQPLAERLSRFRSDEYVEAMARCCETAQRSKRGAAEAVVLHGDCWISNLMFHESDEEVMFVDWQGARYGSVALDLSYFLFCCTDKAVRAKMDELLRCYHGALMQRIGQLCSDGEQLMPLKRLYENMRECGVFGMGMAIMTLHSTTCPSAEMLSLTKSGMDIQAISRQMAKNPAYQRRIVDVCRDAVRLGYL